VLLFAFGCTGGLYVLYLGKSIQCIAIVIGCNEDVNKNERNWVPRIFTC